MSEQAGDRERSALAQGREPLWLLVHWLVLAVVARVRSRMPMRLVNSGITACGLVLLCLPLLLWMAWSKLALGIILALGFVAGALILLLLWLSPEDRF